MLAWGCSACRTGSMKKHKHKQRANAVRRAQGVSIKPTKTTYTTLRQMVQYIPEGLPERLAKEVGADIRKFSCTSHVIALLCGHLSRASSLNEICDAGRLHEGELNRIRGAVAPKRNTFSNANRTRYPIIAERLYWETFNYLEQICPGLPATSSIRNTFRGCAGTIGRAQSSYEILLNRPVHSRTSKTTTHRDILRE